MHDDNINAYIQALNYQLYTRDRIIQNYNDYIYMLQNESREKDHQHKELKKKLLIYEIEEIAMKKRRAFLEIFFKEKYNITVKVEDIDEFITEKQYEAAKKRERKNKDEH